jgi:hypothetical protein
MVYYFKRIFNNKDSKNNVVEDDEESYAAGESSLQLFRYDLEKNEESAVEFIYCDEDDVQEEED